VKDVIAAVERATGLSVTRRSAPRRAGDPAVLYASAARIRRDLGWVPQRPDLDAIVADAWRWHAKRPHGFGRAGR
jgi:UDP-glucose 4-epimerase